MQFRIRSSTVDEVVDPLLKSARLSMTCRHNN